MKKALVLGGTLFFGKRLVQHLLDRGWEVTIATRGIAADPFGEHIQRLILDRENKETLLSALGHTDTYWDCVFDQTCYSPLEIRDVLDVLHGRIGHYVLTSTMAVYEFGVRKQESEYDPLGYPIHYRGRREYPGLEGYREAKRQAEAVLFQSGIPGTAIRFPLVIGPDDYTGRFQFHVDRVKTGVPIGITRAEDRIGFIDSDDAARFLLFAAENKLTGSFNAGSPGDISFAELLERIGSQAKMDAQITATADPAIRSPYDVGGSLSLDVSKACSAGFQFRQLDDLLDELIMHDLLQSE